MKPLKIWTTRLFIVNLILTFGVLSLYPLEADGKQVKVKGYYRKDGTYVRPHYRTAPDGNPYNNYSYPGNYNPNTGKITTGDPQKYLDRYYNKSRSSSSSLYSRNGSAVSRSGSNTTPFYPKLTRGGYFTVGSTKDEVLAVQGTPKSFSDWEFDYGSSSVYFSNGRVTRWYNSPFAPLKARLVPKSNTINRGYFTVGSTKDEVLAVQGTPKSFSDW
ncbi:MAG: hypothetical protein OXT74_00350, partial [Candidatus Poribacteria bacterium]|nr:hypothetical protein [Candidatus Poribacteria bacterium]